MFLDPCVRIGIGTVQLFQNHDILEYMWAVMAKVRFLPIAS